MALTEKQLDWHRKHRENLSPERKESRRARALARYHERRDQDLPKMRAYSKQRYASDRRLSLYDGAKRRASLDGIPFTITIEDIVIPQRCPVLGILLVTGASANHPALPSLDKFIPALGYVPGNINVISLRANSLKKNATIEEVAHLLAWMQAHVAKSLLHV